MVFINVVRKKRLAFSEVPLPPHGAERRCIYGLAAERSGDRVATVFPKLHATVAYALIAGVSCANPLPGKGFHFPLRLLEFRNERP